jgi:hypothetical protein
MPPSGVSEATAHVNGLLDNDMRGDVTVRATLAQYARVSGYTPDEPGFFPVTPLTTRPMTGFALVKEVSNDKEKVPEVRDTVWARLLGDILPDD